MRVRVSLLYPVKLAFVSLLLIPNLFAQRHSSCSVLVNHDSPAGRSVEGLPCDLMRYSPDPAYTKAAHENNVKGVVILQGTLETDGCIRNLRVVRRLGYGLDENAIYAIERWKFEAFKRDGIPAVTPVRIEVLFDPKWSVEKSTVPADKCGEQ